MKARKLTYGIALYALVPALILLLAACASGKREANCQDGLCIEFDIAEPIHINERTPVTVTVTSDHEEKDLWVYLSVTLPGVAPASPSQWNLDIKKNNPFIITSFITITQKSVGGYVHTGALLLNKNGLSIADSILIHVTENGGTPNPDIEGLANTYNPNTLFQTPQPPLPTLTPFRPQIHSGGTYYLQAPIPDNGTPLTVTLPVTANVGEQLAYESRGYLFIDHPQAEELIIDILAPDGQTRTRVWDRQPFPPEKRENGEIVLPFTIPAPPQRVRGTWTVIITDTVSGIAGTFTWAILRISYYGDPQPPFMMAASQPITTVPILDLHPIPADGTWQTAFTENFESSSWNDEIWERQDLSNDGYERYWGRMPSFSGTGGYQAAWPARDGRDGIAPGSDDNYPNNMNTRMIAGPFYLHNSIQLSLTFDLQIEIENYLDYLDLEVSRDGVSFRQVTRWDTSTPHWEDEEINLQPYAGEELLWLSWRFYSNDNLTFAGPIIDNIELQQYLPGRVQVTGSLFYYDRDGQRLPAPYTKAQLYDDDAPPGFGPEDDHLASVLTNAQGYYRFPAVRNWDDDDLTGNPAARRLDLYVVWQTDASDSPTAHRMVTDLDGAIYQWNYPTIQIDIQDGTSNLPTYTIQFNNLQIEAMWIFQDLRNSWEYVSTHGTDPGSVAARWEQNLNCYSFGIREACNSFIWPYFPISGIFISDIPIRINASDPVVHEVAHHYMYNAMDWWFWDPSSFDDFNAYVIQGHDLFDQKTPLCAWTEGWAEFFPLAVNGDPCLDEAPGHCLNGSPNLETHNRNDGEHIGDNVEARVAQTLYDLYDSDNDGKDTLSVGFQPLWEIIRTDPVERSFADFWAHWKESGQSAHLALPILYQNGIDYNTPPELNLPDRTVLAVSEDILLFDLWAHAADVDTPDSLLSLQLATGNDINCHFRIEQNRYLNLKIPAGWTRTCRAQIKAGDGVTETTDTTTLKIVPVYGNFYLPSIKKVVRN